MRVLALLALLSALAACSKQEPPLTVAAVPAKPAPAQPAAATVAPVAPVVVSTPLAIPTPAAPAAPLPDDRTFESVVKDGSAVYDRICATCHMADGNGVPFMQPAIKGSVWISNPDPQLLLSLILRGATVLGQAADAYDNKMAPQDALSDAEIAAVATYVRQRFAAVPITKPVTPAEVAVARARPGLPQ